MFIEKKTSRSLFCVFMGDWRELEWIMPMLSEYKKMNKNFTVLLPSKPRSPRQKIMYKWIKVYTNDIVHGDSIYKHINDKKITLMGFLFKSVNIINSIGPINIAYIYRYVTIQLIIRYLDDIDFIYVPEKWLLDKLPKYNLFGCMIRAGKILNKPFIGYVFSSFSKNKQLSNMINNRDFNCKSMHLLISNEQKSIYDNAEIHSKVIGPQRFYNNWVKEVENYFSSNINTSKIINFAKNRSTALVLLKNRSGLSTEVFNENIRFLYKQKLFEELINNGFKIIIKPHPGENLKLLKSELKDLNEKKICISHLPAQYLSTLCECGVFEFPSNSFMDVLAANKPVYFPMPSIIKKIPDFKEKDIIKKLLDIGFPKNFFDLSIHKIPKKNKRVIPENINNYFDFNLNMMEIIKQSEKYAIS